MRSAANPAHLGETTQMGCARLVIEWCTKSTSSGDSEGPVTAPEVVDGAEIFDNSHFTNKGS